MKVETKFGTERGGQDSWVGKGEVLTDGDSAHVVSRGSGVGTDDVPAKTEGDVQSAVLGNLPWIRMSQILGHSITYAEATRDAAQKIEDYDKTFNKKRSDDIETRRGTGSVTRNTEMLREKQRQSYIGQEIALVNQAAEDQKNERPLHQMGNYSCGKNLPKHDAGWIPNAITSGLGIAASIGQYVNARNQKLNNPNVYAANPYEQQALTTLAGLRDNPYNQLRAMQDVEARNRYAISQSGGLTGSQRYLANIAGGIGLQRNYADVLQRAHAQNNQYKAQWANAALSAGAQTAQRQMTANTYRDEAYARSHAARQQQMQMAIQNGLGQIQQYYANEFKRNQFNRMMDLYWAEHNANRPSTTTIPHTGSLNLGAYEKPNRGTVTLNNSLGAAGGQYDLDYLRKLMQIPTR